MKSIEAGIFDVGGVLHTNEIQHVKDDIQMTLAVAPELFAHAWRELTLELGEGRLTELEYWNQFLQAVHARNSLPDGESLLVREYARRFRVHEDVLALTSTLRLNGYKLAILSNTIASHADYLTAQNLFENFTVRIFSHEVGISKPEPEIYRQTLAALDVAAEQTFFVDDNQKNVLAAEKLGMHGIVFENAAQLKTELSSLGVAIDAH
jgi:putative hydrolase of the HAD superfamily